MQLGGWKLGVAAALALVCVVAFFGLGYYAAVVTAGVDPTTAIKAATAFGQASPDAQDALSDARFALRRTAQSPAYAVQRVSGEGVRRLTTDMPDFLRMDPKVMGLIQSGDSSQTSMIRDYEKALNRFEAKAIDSATTALDPAAQTAAAGPDSAAAAPGDGAAEPAEIQRREIASDAGVPGQTYAVELGSFLSPERAETFAASLIKDGHAVAIAEQVDGAGRTWLHVRLGPYPTYAAAARIRQRMTAQGLSGAVVEETALDQQSNAGAVERANRPVAAVV